MRTVSRNLSQTRASRESLTAFHWLPLVGFKLEQLDSPSDTMESLHVNSKELLVAAFLSNAC